MCYTPLVSVIAINHNNTSVTRDLLRSLRNVAYPFVEIIIVDNGSADKGMPLKEEFPEIDLVQLPTNRGYSGGNNAGIRASNGELVLLINNDTEVTAGFLIPMIQVFEQHPDVGMVSPRIIYMGFDHAGLIQYAGSTGINQWTGRGKKTGYLETDQGQYDYVRETGLVHGACLMVSRKLIEKVGMLHEGYFIYYEEHDWAEQAKRHGFKVYYTGLSKIYHKASLTTGKHSPFKTYFMVRNRLLFLRRNVQYPAFITSVLVLLLVSAPKRLIFFLLRMDFGNLTAYLSGLFWHAGFRISPGHETRRTIRSLQRAQ